MIDCVITIDYELYGDGSGALRDLVYEPAVRLMEVFRRRNVRFVAFVEAAELERIEACGTDDAIELVTRQVRELYADGFEVGLHLHPQWCNARFVDGRWRLDDREYNLCTLPRERIVQIVETALTYLRHVVDDSRFTPLSFRAGNWLFQPTETAAGVLAQQGIRIDSSVFKGGRQHQNALDYRRALGHGYSWPFSRDVTEPDPAGPWTELPIYTEMVAFWRMLTAKRVGLQARSPGRSREAEGRLYRILDFVRPRYPLKLDVCRMGLAELTAMMERIIREDRATPEVYRPIVAIGHTKDLVDVPTVDAFLAFLASKGIGVSTFHGVARRLALTEAAPDISRVQRGSRPSV
jgi:hypothetical protein